MKRSVFEKLVEESKAALQAVASKYEIGALEFDDYIYFWLMDYVSVEEDADE